MKEGEAVDLDLDGDLLVAEFTRRLEVGVDVIGNRGVKKLIPNASDEWLFNLKNR